MIDQQSCGTQTYPLVDNKSCITASVCTQTDLKSPSPSPVTKAAPAKKPTKQTISTKEETHLLSTIRGMRVDLAIKEKALQRLTRELDECKKTIKKLQKENESTTKYARQMWNVTKIKPTTFVSGTRSDKTSKKPYDPAQFTDKSSSPSAVQLQEKIKLLEMDYKSLHDKRLQDVSHAYFWTFFVLLSVKINLIEISVENATVGSWTWGLCK